MTNPRSKPVSKSALTALAFTHYAIKATLADKIGRMVLTTLAVTAIAFAIVDIISGWDWFAASQIILLGAFSIAGTSLVYLAGGRHEAHEDGPPRTAGDL